ncbi:uncharacterized protein LOC127279214 isoform X1 [Leptopilina boulardi]|uniref:uncharacterized protein LOC127279214 isoform X1 n=1 Tax=Leptopilina boulardi TaxID=63433 RepID=UPI0021F630EC|nr:uncharacterized protein LOC127279214 isoform X1 [Leptopilina boulardi]XP_051157401.1 uncharacterized protein LOC127279214 isoform X1 [Leptopilina boulardi]
MWRTLLLGLTGFAYAQEADDDDAVVNDVPENKIPSPQELLKMLNSMGLSEEEKNKLREDIMNSQGGQLGPDMEENIATTNVFFSQTILLLLLLSLISSIFVFFGYKLYKSLSERERKREEKKKMKQLKKKK